MADAGIDLATGLYRDGPVGRVGFPAAPDHNRVQDRVDPGTGTGPVERILPAAPEILGADPLRAFLCELGRLGLSEWPEVDRYSPADAEAVGLLGSGPVCRSDAFVPGLRQCRDGQHSAGDQGDGGGRGDRHETPASGTRGLRFVGENAIEDFLLLGHSDQTTSSTTSRCFAGILPRIRRTSLLARSSSIRAAASLA